MNRKAKELIQKVGTDTSGRWVSTDQAEVLVELTMKECILAVQNTGKQCAYTTHDLGTVDCTIEKSVQSIKQHFNIKQ
jgi:hypothetical protein